ncbi:MAG: hypothetical protein QM582_14565 [Micropruina sp.]|uniref:hypothetical protein n=1 Tax=Micropruina sp. TaxID=2737536 RepID=UPI0039E5B5C8
MTDNGIPDPAEARASLDQVAQSRRAAVRVTRRPFWLDAALALVVGIGVTLGFGGQVIAALVVLVAGCAGVLVAERKVVRRQGQVFDRRALGARMWRFAVLYVALALLRMVEVPAAWQLWFAIAGGLFGAVGILAWLRWEDRYQGRRLAAGDYDRYDLL